MLPLDDPITWAIWAGTLTVAFPLTFAPLIYLENRYPEKFDSMANSGAALLGAIEDKWSGNYPDRSFFDSMREHRAEMNAYDARVALRQAEIDREYGLDITNCLK